MLSSRQRGFTLIELVVVIVILGILAAFAVPRFMGLENQARLASVNALAGSLRSSASMAHGVWMTAGTNPASITIEGTNITMTNGYPSVDRIDDTIQDISGFTYDGATGTFTPRGARNAARCFIRYVPAPLNGTYTLQFPNGNTGNGVTGNAATAQNTLRTNC
jgi:MSHA pilin protein MshA